MKKLLLVLLSLQLLACGGGGGGSSGGAPEPVKVNLPPTAIAQTLQAQSGTTFTGQLQGTDPEQLSLTYRLVNAPDFGTLQITSDGRFTLVLPQVPSATELQFSFLVDDGQHKSAAVPVTVEIIAATGTMVAVANKFQAVKGTALQGQLKFLNATAEPATILILKKPAEGTLALKPDGSFSYLTPKISTARQDSFEFYVANSKAGSAAAKVDISLLEAPNAAPQIVAQSFSLAKGSTLNGQLQATDADTDPLTFRLLQQPQAGSLELQQDGRFVLNVDRIVSLDQLRFEVAVADGLLSSSAMITINLTPFVNIAPVAQPQMLTVAADDFLLGSVQATDVNNDNLRYELVQAPAAGELQLQQNGQFKFIAPLNAGEQSFSFRAFDGELYSQSATISFNVTATKAQLDKSSYLKYALWGQQVSGVIYQSSELIAGGQSRAQQLKIIVPPRAGEVTVADGVFVYNPTAEKTAPATDRFVLQQQLPDGSFELVRIELDFSHPAFLDHEPDSKAPLAPEWQSAADFPDSLTPILQGLDPFKDITDFSEKTRFAALKALDVLARNNNATDLHISRLAYYLRAAYFNTEEDETAQWMNMLETMLYRLSRIDGFFSNSDAGLKLQSALSDSGYVLQYFASRPDRMIELVESGRLVLQLMLRQAFDQADYQWKLTYYDQMDMQDRLLYGVYLTQTARIGELLSQQLQQLQQQLLQHIPLLDVKNSNPRWPLNAQLMVAKSLWFASHNGQREAVIQNTASIVRTGGNTVDVQQLSLVKLSFYKNFIMRTFGYYDAELGKSRCKNEFSDICREVSIAEVLPKQHTCPQTVTFVYDQISAPQLTQLCTALDNTATRFHDWMQTANQPLPGDLNDSLEAVVFNSSVHYQDYGGVLFDVGTNNGGIYLEGNPADPENQARYLAYQRVVNERWWVWNLEHEFVHYLEGRFIAAGDYSTSSQVAGVWWGEGLAEWVAWGEEFPRGFSVFLHTPADKRPDLATIFKATYANSDLAYHWSYSVHYFLSTKQRSTYLQLAECLKKADQACVSKLELQIVTDFAGQYAQFMTDLVARLDTPKGQEQYHPSLFRDQYLLLEQHSLQHSPQQQQQQQQQQQHPVLQAPAQPAAAKHETTSAGPGSAVRHWH